MEPVEKTSARSDEEVGLESEDEGQKVATGAEGNAEVDFIPEKMDESPLAALD